MSTVATSMSTDRIDDRRERFAAAASMEARRNRPTHLVVLSLVLLFTAVLMLLWALSSRNSSRDDLETARAQAQTVETLVGEWKTFKTTSADPNASRINEPLTSFYSRIESAATRAGMKDRPPSPRGQQDARDPRSGAVQKKILYQRVMDAELGALVRWMEFACEDVPGLEVYSLKIAPQTTQGVWVVDVTFSRWERPNR